MHGDEQVLRGSVPRCKSKKLIAWARWIAGAGPIHNGERLWDMDEKYPQVTSEYCREVCKVRCAQCPVPTVLPDNHAGVAAYLQCATQWRASFAGRTGLDYPACIQVLKLHRRHWRIEHPDDPVVTTPLSELMQDLQVIESAILESDNERRDAEEAARANSANK